MKNEDISEKTIRNYLIGILDEPTTETLDELSVTSQEFADRLAAEQYELVDDWVAGRLDVNEKAAFTNVLNRSPGLVEKVKMARLLTTAPRVVVERPIGFFAGLFGGLPRLAYGLAGIVLLVGFVSVIFYLNRNNGTTELAQAEPPQIGTNNVVPSVEPTEESPSAVPTPMPANGIRPDNSNLRKPTPEPTRSTLRSFVALTLSPPTRGGGEIKSVRVDPGVEYLELNVQTEAQTGGRLLVELGDPNSGRMDWRSPPLKARVQKGRTVLSVRIPAANLKKGVRSVRLREASSPSEILDEHLVRIDR